MAFILTITMMFCGFGSTEAFAMELSEDINNSNQITSVAADSDFAYNTNLVYGTSKFVSMGESFRNKEDFAVLHLNNDLRTHRVLLKVSFQKLTVRRKMLRESFLIPIMAKVMLNLHCMFLLMEELLKSFITMNMRNNLGRLKFLMFQVEQL